LLAQIDLSLWERWTAFAASESIKARHAGEVS